MKRYQRNYSDLSSDHKVQKNRLELTPSFSGAKAPCRLWVMTELYYPEDNQTGYFLTKTAEGLAENLDVKVICGQPSYAARGTRAAKNEVHNRVEIFRVWGTTLDKNVLVFRLLNMLTLGVSMFLKSLFSVRPGEEILVVSAPPSLPFITAITAKIRRANYTLVLHDKYPDLMVAAGKAKADSLLVRGLHYLNGWLYGSAKKIIVLGRDMKELIERQLASYAKVSPPIVVIQSWAALEEVEPLPRDENPLLKELGILDKFVFLYAGNMGYPQDLESIVKCAKELKDEAGFHFLFIGAGAKRKWLEREVKELKNVTVLDPRPRSEQKIFLNACDVGIVSLIKDMWGVAMPSRTYNILAAGKPILALAEDNSELARVIKEENVGWFVPPFAPDKLLAAIYQIYKEREKIPEMEKRARKSALEKYSEEVAIKKYKTEFLY